MQPPKKIKEYLNLIDEKYREAKAKRISRFSVEWGIWSRKMNLETRPLTEAGDEESIFYKYLFIYWIVKSELLELHFESKLGKRGQKRKKAREAADTKQSILEGNFEEGGAPFHDIMSYLATLTT